MSSRMILLDIVLKIINEDIQIHLMVGCISFKFKRNFDLVNYTAKQ